MKKKLASPMKNTTFVNGYQYSFLLLLSPRLGVELQIFKNITKIFISKGTNIISVMFRYESRYKDLGTMFL